MERFRINRSKIKYRYHDFASPKSESQAFGMFQREKLSLAKVMRKECLLRQQKIGFFLKCIFTTTVAVCILWVPKFGEREKPFWSFFILGSYYLVNRHVYNQKQVSFHDDQSSLKVNAEGS